MSSGSSIKVSKVFDPISMKFIDPNTSIGNKIKKYNKMCEKCPDNKILNIVTNNCVLKKGKNLDKFSNEINYCDKYKLAIKKNTNSNKKILDNILNIKIPKNIFNIKKDIKIKDIYDQNKNKLNIDLAEKLNIQKNNNFSNYINYIPVLLFSIFQVISTNPDVAKYVLDTISFILTNEKGLFAKFIRICTYYVSPFLIKIISSLNIKKFFLFISGLIMTITNMSPKTVNKNTINKISEQVLTGKRNPFTLNTEIPFTLDHQKRVDNITEFGQISIQKLNAYNPVNKSVSLSKLGLNYKDIIDPHTSLNFGYNDINRMPFVEVINNTKRIKTSVYLLPYKDRIKQIEKIKSQIADYTNILNSSKSEIIKSRSMYDKYINSLELTNEIQEIEDLNEKFRKGTPVYNKNRQKLIKNTRKLNEIKSILESENYVPISEPELNTLSSRLSNVIETTNNLRQTKKSLSNINHTNFNWFQSDLLSSLESFKNTINSINKNIFIIPKNKMSKVDISPSSSLTEINNSITVKHLNSNFNAINNALPTIKEESKMSSNLNLSKKEVDSTIMEMLMEYEKKETDEPIAKKIANFKEMKNQKRSVKTIDEDDF